MEIRYDRGWQWAFDLGKCDALDGSVPDVPFLCRTPLMHHAYLAGMRTSYEMQRRAWRMDTEVEW